MLFCYCLLLCMDGISLVLFNTSFMRKSWVLGVWNMFLWLFGGLPGRREIDVSLMIKFLRF